MSMKESEVNYTKIINTLRKITDYISDRIYGDCWFKMYFDSDGDFYVIFMIELSSIEYVFSITMGKEEILKIFSSNTEEIIIKIMYNQLTADLEKKIIGEIYRKDVDNTDPS